MTHETLRFLGLSRFVPPRSSRASPFGHRERETAPRWFIYGNTSSLPLTERRLTLIAPTTNSVTVFCSICRNENNSGAKELFERKE